MIKYKWKINQKAILKSIRIWCEKSRMIGKKKTANTEPEIC